MVTSVANNGGAGKLENGAAELSVLARHFELYNRTEGKSLETIDWYNQALKQLVLFLGRTGRSTLLADLGETEVRELILHLQGRRRWQDNPYVADRGPLAAITIQTHVRALRAFFNWLHREGYTPENRLARLKPPSADGSCQHRTSNILITPEQNHLDYDARPHFSMLLGQRLPSSVKYRKL